MSMPISRVGVATSTLGACGSSALALKPSSYSSRSLVVEQAGVLARDDTLDVRGAVHPAVEVVRSAASGSSVRRSERPGRGRRRAGRRRSGAGQAWRLAGVAHQQVVGPAQVASDGTGDQTELCGML